MNLFSKFNNKKISKNSGIFLVSSLVTLIIIGINYTGLFQLLELTLFDHFFRFRSSESKEEKIVIVTIDDEDINNVQQWPLSDQLMAKLLRKIISQKPITIGLDIYKDIPVNPGYQDLVNVFESFPNLIGVQKIGKKIR